jgi:hypothetical protein
MLTQREFKPVYPWRKPVLRMTRSELKRQLLRVLVLEHSNGRSKPFPQWGWEKQVSMNQLRRRRMRLARQYVLLYEPVSALVFKRSLPRGREWPGTGKLLSSPIFSWEDGVWAQRACSLPLEHINSQQI